MKFNVASGCKAVEVKWLEPVGAPRKESVRDSTLRAKATALILQRLQTFIPALDERSASSRIAFTYYPGSNAVGETRVIEPGGSLSRRLRDSLEVLVGEGRSPTIRDSLEGVLIYQAACVAEMRVSVDEALDLALASHKGPSDTDNVYFEFQVEKQVSGVPGTVNLRYPDMLRSANIEGEVLVQFVVDTTGRADLSQFKVLKSSHDLFTNSVRNALSQMRFYPAEIGGRKVKQLVQQPFNFALP